MRRSLFFVLFVLVQTSIFAQKNIVVKIGDKAFTKEEYETIYRKNNTQLSDEAEVKTPEEYVDLFVDYKLKVIEAENLGYDTVQAFIDELAGYRDELAKPYLTDITVTDSMVKLAYYRTVNEIRASHILINVAPDASPEDTLKAYNRIIELHNMAVNGLMPFAKLAYEFSEDPSAKSNNGDLRYFKAFGMITEFEDAAYSTPVGEISMPVRTKHGYHIILVTDLKKTEDDVKTAHIMKIFSDKDNVSPEEDARYKKELDSIYNEIQNGANFAEMVRKHSGDQSTMHKDGEMTWLNRTFGVDEFIDAAYALEVGEISKPVRTPYGWHIIKLIDKRGIRPFEELENELSLKIKRDPKRSKHSKQSYLNKKKAEYNFQAFDDNIQKFIDHLKAQGDTVNNIAPEILSLPMYQVADVQYTVANYMELQEEKKSNSGKFLTNLVIQHLEPYADEVIDFYESSKLEEKYPEFNNIMQEYRDGMLLFAIMQDEVWNKAALDTVGLNKYYEQHKDIYQWDEYFEGLQIRCFNAEAYQLAKKLIEEQGITDADSLKSIINKDNPNNVRIYSGRWEKGDNDRVDHMVFGGIIPVRFNAELEFVHGKVVPAGQTKTLHEARGLYVSDYQKVLEEQWMNKLRKKYKVKVNKKLLKTIEKV
ncbi:MAG: peptidylprolyl isomerase [Prolixibacteraceae bacterium]|nr:peptidylprolyl isomerase [Prolixibacteraceae bacterium]